MKSWLIFMILLFSYPALAANTLVDADFFSGDYLTVENDTFLVIGTDPRDGNWNNYSALILKNNLTKDMMKIGLGKCHNTEYYEYCFNDSYYNWDKKKTYENWWFEPSMRIKVFYYNPDVTLTRPDKIEFAFGRAYSFDQTFKNTGSKEARVKYVEHLPKEFEVAGCNICNINGNTVTADIRLVPGEEQMMTYMIRHRDYTSRTWSATYNYTYDDKFKSSTLSTSSSVKVPYSITQSITRQVSTTLGDITTYDLTIWDNDEYDALDVNLSLTNNVVKEYEHLTKSNNTYTFVGQIHDNRTFRLIMDSYLIGNFPIKVKAFINVNGHQFIFNDTYAFNVSLNPLTPNIIVSNSSMYPDDTVNVVASLKNTDERAQYLYVYARLLPNDEQWTFNKINPGKEMILYNGTMQAPENGDLTIVLTGIYRTQNMQDQTFKLIRNVSVIRGTTQDNPQQPPSAPIALEPATPPADQPETTIIKTDAPLPPPENKKDFISAIIDGIDKLIKSIFG